MRGVILLLLLMLFPSCASHVETRLDYEPGEPPMIPGGGLDDHNHGYVVISHAFFPPPARPPRR